MSITVKMEWNHPGARHGHREINGESEVIITVDHYKQFNDFCDKFFDHPYKMIRHSRHYYISEAEFVLLLLTAPFG